MSSILAIMLGGTEGLSDLPAPKRLDITSVSGTTVTSVTWDPYPGGTGATSFRLYRNGVDLVASDISIAATSTNPNDTRPADSETYYTLRAHRSDDDELSAMSEPSPTYYAPAAAPSDLDFDRTGELTYTLTWSNNSEHDVTFSVWRSVDGGGFSEFQSGLTSPVYNGTWSSLPDSAQFYVTARRTNPAGGHSEASNTVNADVEPAPTPPDAPTSLGVSGPFFGGGERDDPNSYYYTINFTHAGGENIVFVLFKSEDGGPFELYSLVTSPDNIPFEQFSVEYRFIVCAYNNVTELLSANSNTAGPISVPSPPAAPTLNTAAWFAGEVSLAWTNNATPTSTKVYRSTTFSGTYSHVQTLNSAGNTINFVSDSGPGVFYYVTTVNANGESTPSNIMETV